MSNDVQDVGIRRVNFARVQTSKLGRFCMRVNNMSLGMQLLARTGIVLFPG